MQRIFRRHASGSSSRGVTGLMLRLPAGLRLRRPGRKSLPWGKRAQAQQPALPSGDGTPVTEVVETAGTASFRDRGRLRRRLRYLRRARELAFRDVGGLIFDMRRFERDRPDLVEAKLGALTAVDHELRALERVLDDRRPIHELREPGLSSCPRCGALHASEDHFCPRCGLQIGGPQAMGEVGGGIAAPPQAPPAPLEQPTALTTGAPGAAATAPTTPAPATTTTPSGGGGAAPSRSPAGGGAGPRRPSASGGAAPSRSPAGGGAAPRRPSAGGGAAPPRSPSVDGDAAPESQPTEILRPPDAP
ncbi:MAG TPA: zinc ribbon domain-containing protein [Solirubrobacteraceae bacterium]|nr:zinc ribbon domain-containing protein [Solirubrobacteraceae bacterium]